MPQHDDKSVALSGDQVNGLLKGEVKIITYRDIAQYASVSQLLRPHDRVVILYETRPRAGHWVLVHRPTFAPSVVEVFDSYGCFPDDELAFISEKFRRQSNQMRAHLCKLLSECEEAVHWNDHRFQSPGAGVATCGRWAVFRALNAGVDIDEFKDRVVEECRHLDLEPDDVVCRYIRLL